MLYLSQVLGRPVREVEGERVATLKDVIVRLGSDHPPVMGIVARYRRRDFFVPRARVARIDVGGVRLNSDILDLRRFARREGEVLLARDVLDKQLIDVDGKRVVRVNDVQLIESGGEWVVTGADVTIARSEERRVGKECRSRWSPYHEKKNRRRKAAWVGEWKQWSDRGM